MVERYRNQLAVYATQTNDALRLLLHGRASCAQIAVIDAMRYSLLDAGKRIRAALTLEFGRLCGAPCESTIRFACAVEMIHAYSLIHDDLPCMDDDDMRRGKPACHKQYGEATALLAGDGLLTLAFETLAATTIDNGRRVQAVSALASAAGIYGMVGGQVIDLASEGKTISLVELQNLYALKTGALLRVSAQLGCIAGGANEVFSTAADSYARACGLAFQITDDLLDVTGSTQTLGKPIGSDAENNKTTYVTLLGVEGARDAAVQELEAARTAVVDMPDNGFLVWLADMILSRDH